MDFLSRNPIKTVNNGDDKFLEPLLVELMAKGFVRTSGLNYELTGQGQTTLDLFMKRYTEYLRLYDVFGFVDLDKGEFAFSRYFDFSTDDQWNAFKMDSRFEDLRIAVAIFKKLNPAEIVFMSFINEGRLDTESTGWQIDLLSDAIWSEIEAICSTSLKPEQLGEDAMADMTEQGCRLAVSLIEEEAKKEAEQRAIDASNTSLGAQSSSPGYYEETIVFEESYEPYYEYYDPFYVSPFWLVPLILW